MQGFLLGTLVPLLVFAASSFQIKYDANIDSAGLPLLRTINAPLAGPVQTEWLSNLSAHAFAAPLVYNVSAFRPVQSDALRNLSDGSAFLDGVFLVRSVSAHITALPLRKSLLRVTCTVIYSFE